MPRYGKKAQHKVERAMHEMKKGKLRSGRSGQKVTNPKQAVAIGLSEAREAGGKVPKKSAPKKAALKSATSRKTSTKSAGSRTRKKSATSRSADRSRRSAAK